MFPEPFCSNSFSSLLEPVSAGTAVPLWQAGPLAKVLAAAPALPPLPAGLSLPVPPEVRLETGSAEDGPAQVFLLSALLARLLSGSALPDEEGPRTRRTALRKLAEKAAPAPQAAEALFRLLDLGLRMEPTRRYPDRGALLRALEEAEEEVNRWSRSHFYLLASAGALSGRRFPLELPAALGRQPGYCQILFPPDTPGVSRRHCRLDLIWGTVTVTDLGSRYGTAVDGVFLAPDCPKALLPGQCLSLAGGTQTFLLTER